jgi:hypothetical protein
MFCPKCGVENPDNGKFCRRCGTDIGNVASVLSGKLPAVSCSTNKKPVSLARAIVNFFTGIAFLMVSVALSTTAMGQTWWFWMLIPAFSLIGSGIAQYVQVRQATAGALPQPLNSEIPTEAGRLQSPVVQIPTQVSAYKTGELMPPSVTEDTTRHLPGDESSKTVRFQDRKTS